MVRAVVPAGGPAARQDGLARLVLLVGAAPPATDHRAVAPRRVPAAPLGAVAGRAGPVLRAALGRERLDRVVAAQAARLVAHRAAATLLPPGRDRVATDGRQRVTARPAPAFAPRVVARQEGAPQAPVGDAVVPSPTGTIDPVGAEVTTPGVPRQAATRRARCVATLEPMWVSAPSGVRRRQPESVRRAGPVDPP